jgi:hypothetical protein
VAVVSRFTLFSEEVPASRQPRSQVYRDAVGSFVESGLPSVRVALFKKPDAAYAGVLQAVRDLGVEAFVRVSRRQGELFLVRSSGGGVGDA